MTADSGAARPTQLQPQPQAVRYLVLFVLFVAVVLFLTKAQAVEALRRGPTHLEEHGVGEGWG